MEKSKVRMKSWGKASIAGAFLTALVIPLALSANAASQDAFQVRAENTDNPSISSLAGASFNGDDGTTPPETVGGDFAFSIDMACGAATAKMYFDGIGAGSTITDPNGAKKPLEKIETVTETGKWLVEGSFEKLGMHDSDRPFANSNNSHCITSVDQWGDTGTVDASNAFYNASSLKSVVEPPATVTDMSNMFNQAKAFTGDVSGWDVSNVTDMSQMFTEAHLFNSDLSGWKVDNVQDMSGMFYFARSFKSDLSSWNTGNVTNMRTMFMGATALESDLSSWNTGKVTDMTAMFSAGSGFTPYKLNSDISGWDVSKVTNMSRMFASENSNPHPFNGDISEWDVSSVTDMSGMFIGTAFNRSLDKWGDKLGRVTTMDSMFKDATAFNGNIESWDVSGVGSMESMFAGATSFNGNIGGWNIYSASAMDNMFNGASSFTQNLHSWKACQLFEKPNGFDSPAWSTDRLPQWGECE